MDYSTHKRNLTEILEGDVFDSVDEISSHSKDMSAFSIEPSLVVYPKNANDIKKVVSYVKENKEHDNTLSISARAAGTCMSGGSLNNSIIIDTTKYMNKILSWEKNYVRVQPGVMYRDFEIEARKKDLFLPSYTASKSINALGGMVGNNSAGEKTLKYGQTNKYVSELKVVLSDGEEYTIKPIEISSLNDVEHKTIYEKEIYNRIFKTVSDNISVLKKAKPLTSKNAAGYYLWNVIDEGIFDLNQLISGSQGTLCIITEIQFRLVNEVKNTGLVIMFLESLVDLPAIINKALVHKPSSVESFDDKTFNLAIKFFGQFLKKKGLIKSIEFSLKFLPEFFMYISRGIPKMILLFELEGESEDDVLKKQNALNADLKDFAGQIRVIKSKAEASKYWEMRRESFALLHNSKDINAVPFIDDIIVQPKHLDRFLPELNKILDDYRITYTIAGHAGNGNFHIIPLLDLQDKKVREIILELSEKVYTLVLSYNGSITAEHNDGIIRTPFLEQMFGAEIIKLFQDTKNIFDPKNIFNPGKKVSGTKADIEKYLIH